MVSRSRPVRGVSAICWALVGLLGGHFLAYLALYPDAHEHADALSRSGHGWLVLAGPAVVLALAVALVAGLVGGHRGGFTGVPFRALAGIQVTAFLSLELGERLLAGLDAAALFHELIGHGLWLVLLIGVGVQLITARIGSTASQALARAAAATPQRPRGQLRAPRVATLIGRLIAASRIGLHGSRAPPRPKLT